MKCHLKVVLNYILITLIMGNYIKIIQVYKQIILFYMRISISQITMRVHKFIRIINNIKFIYKQT